MKCHYEEAKMKKHFKITKFQNDKLYDVAY